MKTSRRDLPYVMSKVNNLDEPFHPPIPGSPIVLRIFPAESSAFSQGKHGATTVSATMMLAAAAGIRVFVTGGIGGVHRCGEVTMDISADLTELGRTPVAVVCAGAKTVLDIPRTLEYLETQAGLNLKTSPPSCKLQHSNFACDAHESGSESGEDSEPLNQLIKP